MSDGMSNYRTNVELRGRKILVVGVARSGMAVARFARSRGAAVTATDARNESELVNEASELRQLGAELVLVFIQPSCSRMPT